MKLISNAGDNPNLNIIAAIDQRYENHEGTHWRVAIICEDEILLSGPWHTGYLSYEYYSEQKDIAANLLSNHLNKIDDLQEQINELRERLE